MYIKCPDREIVLSLFTSINFENISFMGSECLVLRNFKMKILEKIHRAAENKLLKRVFRIFYSIC